MGLAAVGVVAVASLAAHLLLKRPTPGHWAEAQKSAFIEACNTNCKKSPGVTPDRYPICEKVCACSAAEAEKILSEADLAEIEAAASSGKTSLEQNEKMQRMTKATQVCLKLP